MTTVQEKLYNTDLIVEELKSAPQTYATILKEEVYNATYQFSLRRKVNRLCKDGLIFKTTIPGTRFGQAILYIEPKGYRIVVEASRIGVNVYYFFNYERMGKFYIKLLKYWELSGVNWVEKNNEKMLFEGSILKFI
jgi:hypothetical protein